jgi:hypothetical protein
LRDPRIAAKTDPTYRPAPLKKKRVFVILAQATEGADGHLRLSHFLFLSALVVEDSF